tara:strand:+ start:45 stop:851 length:807 start_codon:yes stop_codon:yes gene_type:complete
MDSLVIVIILLSLIGIYINLGTKTELNMPEFKKKSNEISGGEDMPIDKIQASIKDKQIPERVIYDPIGETYKTGDGLVTDNEIKNLKINTGNKPDTRPYKWMNSSKREINKYGLSIKSLSHEDNFPYNSEYMAYTQAQDNVRSKIDNAPKNPKGMGFRSQVILPKDETNFKENLKFNGRAIAILRNQVLNQNKNLPYMNKVNRHEIVDRASREIHRVINNKIELKDKPDESEVNVSRDASIITNKIKSGDHDESKNSIEMMRRNYNFK